MPTIAFEVLQWLDRHPNATHSEKSELLAQVPAQQWRDPYGHWPELSKHCGQRIEIGEPPRFMNRLSIYRMSPLPRCLYRSPDGRGLAWFASGGDVIAYGRCEQKHCERCTAAPNQST